MAGSQNDILVFKKSWLQPHDYNGMVCCLLNLFSCVVFNVINFFRVFFHVLPGTRS